MSLPVWFDSSEAGAPTLNNVPGSLLEVLRICLITGFNPRAVTSIIVTDEVAVANSAAHGYASTFGKQLLIEGSGEALLNGRKQPLSVGINTFTFAAPGVADGTYTGTITAKRAPLDWAELHTGTNVAIFGRTAPEANSTLLKVVDTKVAPAGASHAYVSMIASATDVDTVTGEITTYGNIWRTGSNSATAQPWVLIGDELGFYFSGRVSTGPICWFGDPELLYPADSGGSLLAAGTTTNNYDGLGVALPEGPDLATGLNSTYFFSTLDSLAPANRARVVATQTWGDRGMTSISAVVPLHLDVYLKTATEIRARLPGMAIPLANRPFEDLSVNEVSGRQFLAANFSVINSASQGQLLFDLTDSWRE